MTSPSSSPSWRKNAEVIFQTLDGYDHLNAQHDTPALKVSFSELYAYATQPGHNPSQTLQEALLSNLCLRRDLKRLLQKQAISIMPRAAAASSGGIEKREGDGFTLTLKTSNANADHVYLIIETTEREESPTLLFIENEEQGILRLNIEDFYEGEAQILLSKDDNIVKALRNHASEVILR